MFIFFVNSSSPIQLDIIYWTKSYKKCVSIAWPESFIDIQRQPKTTTPNKIQSWWNDLANDLYFLSLYWHIFVTKTYTAFILNRFRRLASTNNRLSQPTYEMNSILIYYIWNVVSFTHHTYSPRYISRSLRLIWKQFTVPFSPSLCNSFVWNMNKYMLCMGYGVWPLLHCKRTKLINKFSA